MAVVTDTAGSPAARNTPLTRSGRRANRSWLGVVPFFVFSALMMVVPIVILVVGSFLDAHSNLTLQNYVGLADEQIVNAYGTSIEISLVTAVAGGIFGFLLAYAVILGGLPRILRTILMTFSGVASNFAGVPLALAFTFTLGFQGLITKLLLDIFHIDLYGKQLGFSLYTKLGLELVYLYFQFPLMVLIVAPAIDGLKREWREASENLGATSAQYWRRIALPILMPTLLGTMILLFGNSFGAQATAYQLTAGLVPLVTNVISEQMRGDVLHNEGLGYALAMGMVVIMAFSVVGYSILQRRADRWLR